MVTADGHALQRRGLVYFTVCGIRLWNESAIRSGHTATCMDCLMERKTHSAAAREGQPWPGGRPGSNRKGLTKACRPLTTPTKLKVEAA